MSPLFLPTARQTNFLTAAGLLSLGYALYLRYLVIEFSAVGLACQGGLDTWLCATRTVVIFLFQNWVFGAIALAAALVNLIRPSFALTALGVIAAGFGIVLYNVGGAALAVALLLLSLARPAARPE